MLLKYSLEFNPLRILDSKDPMDIALFENCPKMREFMSPESTRSSKSILDGLDALKIPWQRDDRLVRGLDYYEETVFEFVLTDPALLGPQQNTIIAGGRYNNLCKELSTGRAIPGVGYVVG